MILHSAQLPYERIRLYSFFNKMREIRNGWTVTIAHFLQMTSSQLGLKACTKQSGCQKPEKSIISSLMLGVALTLKISLFWSFLHLIFLQVLSFYVLQKLFFSLLILHFLSWSLLNYHITLMKHSSWNFSIQCSLPDILCHTIHLNISLIKLNFWSSFYNPHFLYYEQSSPPCHSDL